MKSICKPALEKDYTWLEFYSLYLGLALLSVSPKIDCFCVTDKGDGLRKRQHNGAKQNGQAAPLPSGGILKKGNYIMVIRQISFDLKGKSHPFGIRPSQNTH